jgi:hypothetical protein
MDRRVAPATGRGSNGGVLIERDGFLAALTALVDDATAGDANDVPSRPDPGGGAPAARLLRAG